MADQGKQVAPRLTQAMENYLLSIYVVQERGVKVSNSNLVEQLRRVGRDRLAVGAGLVREDEQAGVDGARGGSGELLVDDGAHERGVRIRGWGARLIGAVLLDQRGEDRILSQLPGDLVVHREEGIGRGEYTARRTLESTTRCQDLSTESRFSI